MSSKAHAAKAQTSTLMSCWTIRSWRGCTGEQQAPTPAALQDQLHGSSQPWETQQSCSSRRKHPWMAVQRNSCFMDKAALAAAASILHHNNRSIISGSGQVITVPEQQLWLLQACAFNWHQRTCWTSYASRFESNAVHVTQLKSKRQAEPQPCLNITRQAAELAAATANTGPE